MNRRYILEYRGVPVFVDSFHVRRWDGTSISDDRDIFESGFLPSSSEVGQAVQHPRINISSSPDPDSTLHFSKQQLRYSSSRHRPDGESKYYARGFEPNWKKQREATAAFPRHCMCISACVRLISRLTHSSWRGTIRYGNEKCCDLPGCCCGFCPHVVICADLTPSKSFPSQHSGIIERMRSPLREAMHTIGTAMCREKWRRNLGRGFRHSR